MKPNQQPKDTMQTHSTKQHHNGRPELQALLHTLRRGAWEGDGRITITRNELCLFAEAHWQSCLDPMSPQFMAEEVLEADHHYCLGNHWNADAATLAAKLHLAPLDVRLEMLADLQELKTLRSGENFERFWSQRYFSFQPLPPEDLPMSAVAIVGASLADGSVVIDRAPSHAPKADMFTLQQMLRRLTPRGRTFIEEEILASGTIGKTRCVRTGPGDEIVLALRPRRNDHSRFVKNRAPEDCDRVFVVLKKVGPQRYRLITGFVGHRPEPEIWDERAFSHAPNPDAARERSRRFWAEHALIYDERSIVAGSERPEAAPPSPRPTKGEVGPHQVHLD
jgi:hypothetical protein